MHGREVILPGVVSVEGCLPPLCHTCQDRTVDVCESESEWL